MGTPLAAIGVKIGYYVSSTVVDTPPHAAANTYTHIPDLKTTGDFNPAPNTADATTFDNEEYTTYVDLLKDLGGAIEFSANFTDAFKTAWDACVSAYADGKMWFVVDIDGVNKSVYFLGKPSALGMPSLTANSLIETSVFVTPVGEPVWEADPTWAS